MKSAPQDVLTTAAGPAGPAGPHPRPADPGSFDDRFDELAAVAHRVAFRIVGQREDARDITQETLTRAYARWNRVQPHAAAWVGRVATNLALDHVRRHRRRSAMRRPDRPGGDPLPTAERADLVDALRALPRRQREVVVLRYLADLPQAEVAAALGCSAGTVKSHAHRGLAQLRTRLALPDTPDADSPDLDPENDHV
jgi:RNA polymerase sigma-70 factor (sigma-E family)